MKTSWRIAALLFAAVASVAEDSAPTVPLKPGDAMFFLDAREAAERRIAAAKTRNPKILFALDFLFWHDYRSRKDLAARVATLKQLRAKKLIPANSTRETDREIITQRLVDAKTAEAK
jgi:hypothetical protein